MNTDLVIASAAEAELGKSQTTHRYNYKHVHNPLEFTKFSNVIVNQIETGEASMSPLSGWKLQEPENKKIIKIHTNTS